MKDFIKDEMLDKKGFTPEDPKFGPKPSEFKGKPGFEEKVAKDLPKLDLPKGPEMIKDSLKPNMIELPKATKMEKFNTHETVKGVDLKKPELDSKKLFDK